MKFSHNKPNSEPVKYKFIEMEHPFLFLEPNRLYLMPSMPEEVAVSINQTLADMMDVDEKPDDIFKDYTCIHLQKPPLLDYFVFKTAIMDEGYNVLLPVNNYNIGLYEYLMARIEGNDVNSQISQIINIADSCAKSNLLKLVRIKKPKKGEKFTGIIPPQVFGKIIKSLYTGSMTLFCGKGKKSVRRFSHFKEIQDITVATLDFLQKQKMQKRMVENVNKLRKNNDVEADTELRLMLKNVPIEFVIEMLKNLSKSQLIKASECLDSQNYAKNSHLRFEICKPSEMQGFELPKNKKIKNIGTYMLFISNGQTFEPVDFNYKSSFIVYLIYLIDRFKKKDSIEPIDMLDKEREIEYYKLYNIIYPNHTDEAKSSYFSLTSEFKKDSKERRKKRLGDCYADIKVCVGSVCHNMGEIINPHIIENAGDHLATMPNKIHIPYELLL